MLDRIRDRCRTVAEQASHVHIDHDHLVRYADTLVDGPVGADADPGRQAHGDEESTAAFVIGLDAVNFGSGWFPTLRKRDGMSGYFTIATNLRDWVSHTGPITPERLIGITAADCGAIFGQPLDEPGPAELMQLFAGALDGLGRLVRDHGSFAALVRAADHSAARLVELLDALPEFHDVSTYRGFDVPLYKRAQITVYDLAQAFAGEGIGRFDDLDRLTMFADNLVPHVLRVDGVLRFDDALVRRIEAGEDIPWGTEPEVEIRAVALHAVELLGAALATRGTARTSGEIDTVLWNRGGGERYKAVPRHRTRCTFY